MYNIKQAAARAGVSVPVLRAWERRYGIVHPERTPSGYRQFDDAAIARIRAMRSLIAQGWSPSAAAAAVVAGAAEPGLADDATALGDAEPEARSDGAAPGAGEMAYRFVAAAAAMDATGVDAVLDDLFARGSFERVAGDLLFPALRRLGDAWAAGRVSVAGEHMASAAVLRRLGQALDAASRLEGRGAPIVVGLPPGGRHELGALAFAIAARRAGLAVLYLGPDLPIDEWLRATSGVDAAVIGVATARDRTAALELSRRLREQDPELVIALGGRGAPPPTAAADPASLPERLPEAVRALRDALDQRRRITPA